MRSSQIPTIQTVELAPSKDEVELTQIVGTLWRGKWLIALCMVLMAVLGGYYAFAVATPQYTSSATVALESRDSQVVDFESVVSGLSADQATINTEVEVLRARILLGKIVEQLDLESDPEFNTDLQPRAVFSLGNLLRLLGLRREPDAPPTAQAIRDGVIDELLGSISVGNVRNSYVFRISVVTESPEKSALIADTLARIYINDQLVTKFEATEEATAWLTTRVTELKDELEVAETAVKDYNTTTDLIGPEALAALNRQLKDLRGRLAEDRKAEADMTARLEGMLLASANKDLDTLAELSTDDALSAAIARAQGGSEAARQVLDARLGVVISQMRSGQARLRAQIGIMETSIRTQTAKVETQSGDLVKLQQLEREAAASGLIYEYFLSRLKETSVQQGIQQADSRILSYAVIPERASAPRKGMILVLSAILGGVLGSVLVLLREMRQTGYRSAEDMEATTGVTVIGQIPRAPQAKRKRVLDYIVSKPTSALVEAVRNLRTSILLSNIDKPPQVIMLTSSVPGEGKTTQTLALAQNLAGLGRRVLVIEGDIRRRTFGEYFDLEGRKGVISAVTGEKPLEDIVWHSDQLGVDILIGEKSTVNAADFFSSAAFAEFLQGLRKIYDMILIDTPPVLVVPDARVISQSMDAVIYVVHWDKTPRSLVENGLHAFKTVNVPVTGLVLSQIDPKGMKRYGGRYGEAYSAYGSKYYGN